MLLQRWHCCRGAGGLPAPRQQERMVIRAGSSRPPVVSTPAAVPVAVLATPFLPAARARLVCVRPRLCPRPSTPPDAASLAKSRRAAGAVAFLADGAGVVGRRQRVGDRFAANGLRVEFTGQRAGVCPDCLPLGGARSRQAQSARISIASAARGGRLSPIGPNASAASSGSRSLVILFRKADAFWLASLNRDGS